MPARKIPVCAPSLQGNEERYVLDALRSSWISSSGRYLDEFEEKFAACVGLRHATACTSGTAALHLALLAAGVGPGDEVILQNFTMIATAFALCYCGARPVLVDNEPRTWNMDPGKIEERIGPRTKAILVAHVYGHPADMDPIIRIARRRGLVIIEDAAEAHGARYKGRMCGSLGHVSVFSFYANKIITTGEGGMVLSDDKEIIRRARYYKNLCFPLTGPRRYEHEDVGFNYRMSNLQAAIGLAQLERIEHYLACRRRNARLYNEFLGGIPWLHRPPEEAWAKNAYWMYGVILDEEAPLSREELMRRLSRDGIETRPFFTPLHAQPALKKYGVKARGGFPVSRRLGERGFYLPSGSALTKEEISFVCRRLKAALT